MVCDNSSFKRTTPIYDNDMRMIPDIRSPSKSSTADIKAENQKLVGIS